VQAPLHAMLVCEPVVESCAEACREIIMPYPKAMTVTKRDISALKCLGVTMFVIYFM
jgi:hypothetical protein